MPFSVRGAEIQNFTPSHDSAKRRNETMMNNELPQTGYESIFDVQIQKSKDVLAESYAGEVDQMTRNVMQMNKEME